MSDKPKKRRGPPPMIYTVIDWDYYHPPQAMVDIAKDRTGSILQGWRNSSGELAILAQSCYMQGIQDAAVATAPKEASGE